MTQRLVAGYERAEAAAETALRKQREAALKLGAVQPASGVQAQINTSTGVSGSGASTARESASAFRELLGEQEQAARKAELLRGQLDPLYAAQQRYNGALSSAGDLLRRGAISEAEHTAAVKLASGALREAEQAAKHLGDSVGLNRAQIAELTHSGKAMFDMVMAGQSPLRAAQVEAARVGQGAQLR